MAVPAATFQTFQAIGNREDLADIIYDISPMDTPFMSNIGRASADSTKVEWQTDSLLAASSTNAHIEGDDATTNTTIPTVRFANQCQISTKVPRVTGTQRAVNSAGRRDEYSYQIAKRGRELKRDIESALLGLQAATTGAAASAAALAGVASWLFDNQVQSGANTTTVAVTSGYPGTAPTAGSTVEAITQAHLLSAIAQCWTNGGDPNVVMCDSTDKQVISGFSGIATQYRDNPQVGPATIIGAADVFVSDFGTHQIVANRFIAAANVYVLDMEYWEVSYLRPIQQADLAKTGDSDRCQLIAEYTLCAKEPSSSAKIYTTHS